MWNNLSFSLTTLLGGPDYEILAGEMLMFSVRSANGATACTNITIVDEDILEYDEDFTFVVTSSDPVEPNMLSGRVLIINNDSESTFVHNFSL